MRRQAGPVIPAVWRLTREALRVEECSYHGDEGQIKELGRAKGSCPSNESFLVSAPHLLHREVR